MNSQMQTSNKKLNYEIDDEIDLDYFLALIKRNKYLIASISFLSFLVLVTYSMFKPKIWQGSFQILLSLENYQTKVIQKATASSLMNQVTGKLNSSSIRTEVGVLKSQSVLQPVFDSVNEENKKSNLGVEDLSFSDWKNNKLKIELEDGTTILNILYFDEDRENILPILTKISKEYQKYSGRLVARKISLAKRFLQQQILEYQIKSSSSIKKAQQCATSEDIIIPNTNNINQQISSGIPCSELIREANRAENTLIQLENNLRAILLEEEISKDFWKVITKPTINNKYIGLSKRKAGLRGLLIGSLLGFIISYIKERTSGLIFQKKFLEKILKSKIIYELELQKKTSIDSCIDFMEKFSKVNGSKNIRFTSLSLDKETIHNLNTTIFNKNNFLFTPEINLLKEEKDMIIFITSNKVEKYKDLKDYQKKLTLLNNKVNGILFLN